MHHPPDAMHPHREHGKEHLKRAPQRHTGVPRDAGEQSNRPLGVSCSLRTLQSAQGNGQGSRAANSLIVAKAVGKSVRSRARQDVAMYLFAQHKTVSLLAVTSLACLQAASHEPVKRRFTSWSGRRGSNPRQPAWKAGTLPLSYSRMLATDGTGRGARTRTADLLVPNQARYQLRHTPWLRSFKRISTIARL